MYAGKFRQKVNTMLVGRPVCLYDQVLYCVMCTTFYRAYIHLYDVYIYSVHRLRSLLYKHMDCANLT